MDFPGSGADRAHEALRPAARQAFLISEDAFHSVCGRVAITQGEDRASEASPHLTGAVDPRGASREVCEPICLRTGDGKIVLQALVRGVHQVSDLREIAPAEGCRRQCDPVGFGDHMPGPPMKHISEDSLREQDQIRIPEHAHIQQAGGFFTFRASLSIAAVRQLVTDPAVDDGEGRMVGDMCDPGLKRPAVEHERAARLSADRDELIHDPAWNPDKIGLRRARPCGALLPGGVNARQCEDGGEDRHFQSRRGAHPGSLGNIAGQADMAGDRTDASVLKG